MSELRRAVPVDLDCLFETAHSAFAGSAVSGKGPGGSAAGSSSGTAWRLKTPAADKRDCHFYEKLGFVRTGTETGHGGLEFALYEKNPAFV